MFFVIITLLRQTMTTVVANPRLDQNMSQNDIDEEYFAITEAALDRIILTFIYKLKINRFNDKTCKEATINKYFASETQLFYSLINFYRSKTEDISFENDMNKKFLNLDERIPNLGEKFTEAYFYVFEYEIRGVVHYRAVGQYAIACFKFFFEKYMTERERMDENTQNPSVCPSAGPEDSRMRVILSLINATYQHSLILRRDICRKYGIKQEEPMFETHEIDAFLCKNVKSMITTLSIHRLAEQARDQIEEGFANDSSASFLPALVVFSIGYFIFVYPIERCYELYKRMITKPSQ